MWQSVVNGQKLSFRLYGINNQNFIMADHLTGTWWQQITGEAILGPLKGELLTHVEHDQLTFALWKKENPTGRVLKPDAKGNMESEDWEEEIEAFPTVTELDPDSPLGHRTVVFGLLLDGIAKAYPRDIILRTSPVTDIVGETPVLLVFAEDGKSARVFDRRVGGQTLDLFAKPDSEVTMLVDSQTGSEWDFTGKAVSGALKGETLSKIPLYIDYWFDWVEYNPTTELETFGLPIEDAVEEAAESEATEGVSGDGAEETDNTKDDTKTKNASETEQDD